MSDEPSTTDELIELLNRHQDLNGEEMDNIADRLTKLREALETIKKMDTKLSHVSEDEYDPEGEDLGRFAIVALNALSSAQPESEANDAHTG